jgi:hypothetical protein
MYSLHFYSSASAFNKFMVVGRNIFTQTDY